MVIVNDRNDVMVFSSQLSEINIHTDRTKVIVTFSNVGQRPVVIGEYNNPQQTGRAFGMLVSALESGEKAFRMPDRGDERLNTVLRGGGITNRTNRTTGKTK